MRSQHIFIFLFFSAGMSFGQNIKGRIQSDADGSLLSNVVIQNLSHRALGATSGIDGRYSVTAYKNDTLLFSLLGYTSRQLVFTGENEAWFESIMLVPQGMMLDTVVIRKGLTDYQKDSLERREVYGKAADFRPAKVKYDFRENPLVVKSPISGIVEKHTKYAKELKHFQEMYANDEKDKFVASKYTPEMVAALTGLKEDSLNSFMLAYPMAYEYARRAGDLEIKMWVKYNFKEWQEKQIALSPKDIRKDDVHALEKP